MNIKQVFQENEKGFSLKVDKIGNRLILLENLGIEHGYIVGLTDIKVSDISLEETFKQLWKTATKINADNVFIGGWKNGNDFYLDLCVRVDTEIERDILKKVFNQKAIFNLDSWEVE